MSGFRRDHWDVFAYEEFVQYLHTLVDETYRTFQGGLLPGVDHFLGVRVPLLRKIAKEIGKGNVDSFFEVVQTNTVEEVLIEGFVIGSLDVSYDRFLRLVDQYSMKIDNWAVCDSFCHSLKLVRFYEKPFFEELDRYIQSSNPWQQRMALVLQLNYYLQDGYIDQVLQRSDQIISTDYYVQMGQAWLLSMCYVKYPDKVLSYLKQCQLDEWTFLKTIQKIMESKQVSKEEKERLRLLKRDLLKNKMTE